MYNCNGFFEFIKEHKISTYVLIRKAGLNADIGTRLRRANVSIGTIASVMDAVNAILIERGESVRITYSDILNYSLDEEKVGEIIEKLRVANDKSLSINE